MKKFFYRVFQTIMKGAMCLMPWRQPTLLKGKDACKKIPAILKQKNINSVLIVADEGITKHGLNKTIFDSLNEAKINFVYFDKTVPNPTIDNIEDALKLFKQNSCQAIIAIGGGSPMDCAKGVGARAVNPNKTITQMRGLLKVGKRLPLLIAIPTTAGTGSETTLAAVLTDSKTHEKYALNDFNLIPNYAVLDPTLTVSLPPSLTFTTGMDALTHAVEAFIGKSNTKKTKQSALKAVKLIFENLEKATINGQDLKARENMQFASFEAGLAFTRAYVGNVHAVAHTLGGKYGVPHGLANAIILPIVLKYYGSSIYKKINNLCENISLFKGKTPEQKTKLFIQKIENLNKKYNVPTTVDSLKAEDIDLLATRAYKEANPLYPVPKIFDLADFKNVYNLLLKK